MGHIRRYLPSLDEQAREKSNGYQKKIEHGITYM
jgi:hypothetical protein